MLRSAHELLSVSLVFIFGLLAGSHFTSDTCDHNMQILLSSVLTEVLKVNEH